MQRTIEDHILRLQDRLERLMLKVVHEKDPSARDTMEKEIRTVSLALGHFKTAREIEASLPPDGEADS